MKHCVIITGYIEGSIQKICPELFLHPPGQQPLILCADGGYRLAEREGLLPHVIIGDFDTFENMESDPRLTRTDEAFPSEILRVPVEKDDTDTMLCIKYGLKQGCDSFLIIGGIGGRLDHTIANLQALAYLASRGITVTMKDEETCVTMLSPGTHHLHRSSNSAEGGCKPYRRFSLFAYSPACEGLSIRDAKYELDHGHLENTFPLGVSNEFSQDTIHLSFPEGMLLVIMNHQR